jgi:transposase
MSATATTRTDQYSARSLTLFVALELGEKDWKLALSTGLDQEPRLRTIQARDRDRLLEEIERVRGRLGAEQVTVCYEAGRDGFWLQRFLAAAGIECLIVDSASIEVRRRARRIKTDRLDALKLLSMLIRFALGERDVWSVVRVPSVADEDARSLHREYRTLVKERTRSVNRIRGLLASQGLRAPRIDGDFLQWIDRARLWDGSPVPPGLRQRIEREYGRFEFTHAQVLEIQKDRRDRVRDQEGAALDIVRQLFALRGIGLGSAWTYTMEFFAWRRFTSAKQVGSLAGLAPTPYRSGTSGKELGITKAGNRFVRSLAIEIAWGWLRHQPDSTLTRGYLERFARGGPRARKVGIVALARKLLVALWRYVETGVLPEGAELKA